MDRRQFIKLSAASSLMAFMPSFNVMAGGSTASEKSLILIQFGGGNDALNTFIPYESPTYFKARPTLAIPLDDITPLTESIGLHPSLAGWKTIWDQGELALVQGVGYEQPNRSHFRSIDIWHTASDADEYLTEGWLKPLLDSFESSLDAVVVSGSSRATAGATDIFNFNGKSSTETFSEVWLPEGKAATPAVQFIADSRKKYNESLTVLKDVVLEETLHEFPDTPFGQQCQLIAQYLKAGIRPPVWHLSLGSFDTHSNQLVAHANLLTQLQDGVTALRAELLAAGLWQDTLIASYSEFGRRVAENGSAGTDHGTAATHFVMGGGIKGGVYGEHPSLDELDNGDLIFTTDFKAYYQSLLNEAGFAQQIQLSADNLFA